MGGETDGGGEKLSRAVGPLKDVATQGAGLATFEAVGGVGAATLGEQRDFQLGEKLDTAHRAVAAAMAARAAGAATNRELPKPHRIALFEDLGVGGAGVGHVGMDRVGPVGLGRGTRAAADRLVVAKRPVTERARTVKRDSPIFAETKIGTVPAEQEVVHGSLAGGSNPQCTEDYVDNALRRLDIATDDGRT